MSAFNNAFSALTEKDLRIALIRNTTSTLYSAYILPILAALYIGLLTLANDDSANFGFTSARPVLSLADAVSQAGASTRNTLALVNSGFTGGAIDNVISEVTTVAEGAGLVVEAVPDTIALNEVCTSNHQGVSPCFGAVVFVSSPSEGDGGVWNYTLRADSSLGGTIKVGQTNNDVQIYALPLQRAVDSAIAGTGDGAGLSTQAEEYAFTSETNDERDARLKREYQNSLTDYLGIALIVALIGVTYHMPGLIATERESGLSQLIDAMMVTKYAWEAQLARLLSHYYAFVTIYLPGWIVAPIVLWSLVWEETSIGIPLLAFIVGGLAITSMSLLGGVFFKKAQLSGSIVSVVILITGVIAQVIPNIDNAGAIVLSILFAPASFVFFVNSIAYFEGQGVATNLTESPPGAPWTLSPLVFMVINIVQIWVYFCLALVVEQSLHETRTSDRKKALASHDPVILENFGKSFKPTLLQRLLSGFSANSGTVTAVDNLTLSAPRGQILVLLGANGSGKSSTLDVISGMSKPTRGHVTVDTTGGLGVAPQKNVFWTDLTVEEHIKLFNALKTPGKVAKKAEITELLRSVGLAHKRDAQAWSLSGGQLRKLQLGMMLTGGSAVCCVDEVSSGLDPLSRRKIWDILLAERSKRTIIMTTHFLDEADVLADHIAIMSKGTLRVQGSSAELKERSGSGYYVRTPATARTVDALPHVAGVERYTEGGSVIYAAPNSSLAAEVIRPLEAAQVPYSFSSPTIEDVFLSVADEVRGERRSRGSSEDYIKGGKASLEAVPSNVLSQDSDLGGDKFQTGRPVGFFEQTTVLYRKRFILLKRNWVPYLIAFALPIIAGGLLQLFVAGDSQTTCAIPTDVDVSQYADTLLSDIVQDPVFIYGPGDIDQGALSTVEDTLGVTAASAASFQEFNDTLYQNRGNAFPGGVWLGDDGTAPAIAYRSDENSMYTGVAVQNALDSALSQVTIATSYVPFDTPGDGGANLGSVLQLVIYFAVVMSLAPAFFGLYPNKELRAGVRDLQYSNGARSLPLWSSHLLFDFPILLLASAIVIIIFAAASDVWFELGYLFVVLMLYSLASILLAYNISLHFKSSIATFAGIVAVNGVGTAAYIIAWMFIIFQSDPDQMMTNANLAHFIISAFVPVGSLIRAVTVAVNALSYACDGSDFISYAGDITAYGGPILYLVLQSIFLFAMLLWYDAGFRSPFAIKSNKPAKASKGGFFSGDKKSKEGSDAETGHKQHTPSNEGLGVANLIKTFKGRTNRKEDRITAVDNVSFDVRHSEIYGLLGPNGAGKSTVMSLIRGDIRPDKNGGDVYVEGISVVSDRAGARANLGVCPQHDAIDSMSTIDHLRHYARLRGVPHVERNVAAILKAVGLEQFAHRQAHHLSGGNKRKLSLGIALTGNPSVILLDEPSSGLDAAAKRTMWQTLSRIAPNRSLLLTTHSMEEVEALATRVAIQATHMLTSGTPDELRSNYGNAIHVHLVSRSTPHTSDDEMARLATWVRQTFPSATFESATAHGQTRFQVPADAASPPSHAKSPSSLPSTSSSSTASSIGRAVLVLEQAKAGLGLAHYSVGPTTLNDVFLNLVDAHNVDAEADDKPLSGWLKFRKWFFGF